MEKTSQNSILQIVIVQDFIDILLIMQDLWHAHRDILLIILLKQFIRLNVNTDTMIRELVELNIATAFLNTKALKMI